MKKIILLFVGIAVVAVIAIVLLIGKMGDDLEALVTADIAEIDLDQVPDGTYRGNYSAFPVIVTLDVTVVDHVITAIDIIEHQNGQGAPAEAILADVIAEQSLQVDSIAGATYSSKVILLAIENACSDFTQSPD